MEQMLVKLTITLPMGNLISNQLAMQTVLYFSMQLENGALNYAQTEEAMFVKDMQVNSKYYGIKIFIR